MVADIYIGPPGLEILTTVEGVSDKRELAEDPRPKPEELVSNPTELLSQKKWKYNARQQYNHEDGKYKEYPERIKLKQNFFNNLQNSGGLLLWRQVPKT